MVRRQSGQLPVTSSHTGYGVCWMEADEGGGGMVLLSVTTPIPLCLRVCLYHIPSKQQAIGLDDGTELSWQQLCQDEDLLVDTGTLSQWNNQLSTTYTIHLLCTEYAIPL